MKDLFLEDQLKHTLITLADTICDTISDAEGVDYSKIAQENFARGVYIGVSLLTVACKDLYAKDGVEFSPERVIDQLVESVYAIIEQYRKSHKTRRDPECNQA
jgi:hypothetical protein